jgi:hypothetical protein
MNALPDFEATTRSQIFRAYEKARDAYEPVGINVGDLGFECERSLWYSFRHASPAEIIEGRKLRIFDTGNREEERILDDLRAIGCIVRGGQERVTLVGGHVRGRIDGEVIGVIEAPHTVHIVECKSSNEKGFKEVQKQGVAKAKPLHYCQCQIYMHGRQLTRALYVCVNKNDDDLYIERIAYDQDYCERMLARAERIIKADDPPSKLHEDPTKPAAYVCGFCKHKGVCHDGAFPRRNCRTCLFSTAITTGDQAGWDCGKWSMPLSLAQQEEGCGSHLFLPGLVPGEQVDAGDDWVLYKLRDGTAWFNGQPEADSQESC